MIDEESAVAAKHPEDPLDLPSPGLDLEPDLVLAPDQFEVDSAAKPPGRRGLAVEAVISPRLEQRTCRELGLKREG